MRRRDKASLLDVLLLMMLFIGCTIPTALSLQSGQVMGGLCMGTMLIMHGWMLAEDLRAGVRRPTRYEWFRSWMNVRPFVVIFGGLALLIGMAVLAGTVVPSEHQRALAPLLVVYLLVWVGTAYYTLVRVQHRHESDAAYKNRVKYRE